MLFVVTLDGCGACSRAIDDLNHAHIAFTELKFSKNNSPETFCAQGYQFPTPLTCLSDEHGRIVYQHFGWGTSQESGALLAEIANAYRQLH